ELAAGELDRRLRAAEEPVARELDLPHEPARLGHVGERRLRVMLVEADDDAAAVPERRLAVRQPEEIDPRAAPLLGQRRAQAEPVRRPQGAEPLAELGGAVVSACASS